MGNGASAAGSQLTLLDGDHSTSIATPITTGLNNKTVTDGDGGPQASQAMLQDLLPQLKTRLQEKDKMVGQYQLALEETKYMLRERDSEIEKLRNEIHKLRSVLAVTVHKDGKPDILSTIHEEAAMAGQDARIKKQGVSGESSNAGGMSVELQHFDKDFRWVVEDHIFPHIFSC